MPGTTSAIRRICTWIDWASKNTAGNITGCYAKNLSEARLSYILQREEMAVFSIALVSPYEYQVTDVNSVHDFWDFVFSA